jgi:hypothetical protein
MEGMTANVAKINSVGLRLALKELAAEDTISAVISGLWDWRDLPCATMFPACQTTTVQSS